MPTYLKTKVIEDSLSKIDSVENELKELLKEIKSIREKFETVYEDIQNRQKEASRYLESE